MFDRLIRVELIHFYILYLFGAGAEFWSLLIWKRLSLLNVLLFNPDCGRSLFIYIDFEKVPSIIGFIYDIFGGFKDFAVEGLEFTLLLLLGFNI